jgi:uncharacterized repeat protein (TIGR01451 family)
MDGVGEPRGWRSRIARIWLAAGIVGATAFGALAGGSMSGAAPPTEAADLSITKTDRPDPVQPGGTVTYTISVTNAGPDAATNVTVTDRLPNGVTFLSASTTSGNCSQTKLTVTCDLGAISSTNGQKAERVTIHVKAPSSAGEITDIATVSSTTKDTNHSNNSASQTTTVSGTKPPATPSCHGHLATIAGTPGDDSLTGTNENDVIVAGAGDDHVVALAGRDRVCAGPGADVVNVGADGDHVWGGRGRDRIRGRGGDDNLHGSRGADYLRGGNGNDLLAGGRGADRCVGGAGRDTTRSC